MPLASASRPVPSVTSPAVVTNVGDGKAVAESRESARVDGQCRTHIAEGAVASLLTTVDMSDDSKVQSLFDKLLNYIKTGKYAA